MSTRVFLIAFAILILSGQAYADTVVPPVSVTSSNRISGGTGSDWHYVSIRATETLFSSKAFFLRFNVITQQLTGYNLPDLTIRQKCEFRRASGGSIGDYKPKNVYAQIRLGDLSGGIVFWGDGHYGQDENDNPVARSYRMAGRLGALNDNNRQYLARICAGGTGVHFTPMTWTTFGLCRWKPENWFKPGNFPFEYEPLPIPMLVHNIAVYCDTH